MSIRFQFPPQGFPQGFPQQRFPPQGFPVPPQGFPFSPQGFPVPQQASAQGNVPPQGSAESFNVFGTNVRVINLGCVAPNGKSCYFDPQTHLYYYAYPIWERPNNQLEAIGDGTIVNLCEKRRRQLMPK